MKKLDNKGFTLLELMAVIILLLVMVFFAFRNFVPSLEKNKRKTFVTEANIIAEAALNKRASDKMAKDYVDDLFYGESSSKACYTFKGSLVDYYVNKYSKSYDGSVEVCYGDDCTYDAKIWLTDGEHFIDGKITNSKLSIDDISNNFSNNNYLTCGVAISEIKDTYDFNFIQTEKRFYVVRDGVYSLEAWGAQGGTAYTTEGGYGAYAYTEVELHKGDILYVRVGGQGNLAVDDQTSLGGFNGGGDSYSRSYYGGGYHYFGAGGGLTSIATKSGELNGSSGNIITPDYLFIIAGGGSGGKADLEHQSFGARNAGGITDQTGSVGQTKTSKTVYGGSTSTSLGHGGGYFSGTENLTTDDFASGGSSYIGNPQTRNGVMYGVNVPESNDTYTKTISTANVSEEPIAQYGKKGNGYARITYIGNYSS